ncbi:hypothetical protein BGZ70_003048 [Mortierella alpina]|uniref:Male-enhanced antigen 1 n=1 Tax=Mortierella alpina TaxID=64518 RepID=A0A9P6M4K9_MORAP|nr:hypothetical protein BGZ70_003048 [Mortierella alpina]
MQTEEHDHESGYEVGQEQLDAVDRMLDELDLEESFDRVPAAFRIVERFEQQRQQQEFTNCLQNGVMANGHSNHLHNHHSLKNSEEMEAEGYSQCQEEHDSDSGEPFGYIPLDQGEDDASEGEDDGQDLGDGDLEDHNGYLRMRDGDADRGDDGDNNDEYDDGQGYDGYLRSRNRDGTVPVPVIPSSVQIDLAEQDGGAVEQIPEEDLKTIAQVMSSFSLPAPDWARSIPEERWLPKIVQQAEAAATSPADASLPSREASSWNTERS